MSISVYKHECVVVVRSQKRAPDPPELDTDGIYKPPDEGDRNQTWVFCKSSMFS